MANGKLGDDPITDMLLHGKHPFPSDIEEQLREIFTLVPSFPDDKRFGHHWKDQVRWKTRFLAWAHGEDLDQGGEALKNVLSELRGRRE